ncbi:MULTISPECIES: replication-associated recombination protein A [Micrococcus]|uniref:replication-associated recombination protein A n=1 Tax=Micrococcus antarcticus TaxID=86171 RepID=UPI002623AE2D|nr:replication-associated recombination protein A [uncultured Micrococcus sp.]
MDDLFSAALTPDDDPGPAGTVAGTHPSAPLAVRMRPRSLDEVLGQRHLLHAGSPLRKLAQPDPASQAAGPSSVILYGPPGIGKTTLAHVIARGEGRTFTELSAITAGVKDVRQVMEQALRERDLYGRTTVLFLDEIHRFTKAQQDALLPGVENRWVVLVAATTENPSFSVIAPLLSRSLLLTLRPLTAEDIVGLVDRAVADERGLNGAVALTDEAREYIVRMAAGDARRALTVLEAAAGVGLDRARDDRPAAEGADPAEADGDPSTGGEGAEAGTPVTVTAEDAAQAMDHAVQRYDKDGDQHYDVISAFIKSIRGSDVDAALHYLARMLEAGEDPRFIARRVVISASEDVGMADPTALQTAVAAAQAVQLIGMPEGRIILAQAVTHLATAPKSNASYTAINEAIADVRAGHGGLVPPPLRDAHYAGAADLGHGKGYVYSHDEPHAVARQQYPPDPLVGKDYYRPKPIGHEKRLVDQVAALRRIVRGQD